MQTENQNRSQKTPNNQAPRGWMRRLVRLMYNDRAQGFFWVWMSGLQIGGALMARDKSTVPLWATVGLGLAMLILARLAFRQANAELTHPESKP